MSEKDEYYHTIGRCLSARGIHPCRLLTNWHNIETAIEQRRKTGVSPYAVVAELWPEPVPSNLTTRREKSWKAETRSLPKKSRRSSLNARNGS